MPFESFHMDQFREHGYTSLQYLFSGDECLALQLEVERFKRDGLGRNVRTDGDGETHSDTHANHQVIPLYDKSALLRALPFEERVVGLIRQLIGEPFLLHLDQMFLKPARSGTGTDWHQDNAYFKIRDPMKGVAMWVAIHDATVANGTLRVIPGSFRERYDHERDPHSDHHIHCRPPEKRAVAIEVPAGGAVFFCYGCAHSTGDNTTNRERAGMAFHFLRTDYATQDVTSPDRECRPHLCGPQASGGRSEYGIDVAGTWRREVARVLSRGVGEPA